MATQTQTPDLERLDEGQIVDPQAVVDLMAALDRVFRIGVYYPSGHAMCDQAAADFLKAFARTLGKSPSLRFSLAGGVLHLQDVPLEEDLRGVTGFREILTLLGISGVVIDSNVSAGEMHRFVMQLLTYRNRVKGAHRFQQLEVEDLPLSISVEHLEFTAHDIEPDEDDTDDEVGDPSNPTLETLLTALARQGLSSGELASCRKLLEAIPGYLQNSGLDGSALPQVGWQDVQKLLLRAVRATDEAAGTGPADSHSTHVNLDALTAIFKTLSERADAENPRQAIDLLLNLSRRESMPEMFRDGAPTRPKPGPSPEIEAWPLQDLRIALDACAVRATGPVDLQSTHAAEELSILMQMLRRDHKLPVQVRIQKRIRDIARTGLQPEEWAVATAGMRDLADPAQEERLFAPLLILTDALRDSGTASVLAFLRDVSEGCDAARQALFWPFLVNEILLEGPLRSPAAYADVCRLAGALADEAMQARLPRLESLAVLRERRCARGALTPPPAELDRVLAVVLGSVHADCVGEALLDGMRQQPPNWLAEAVVPLVNRYEPRHRHFLIEALRTGGDEEPGKSVLESAGRLVGEYLPELTSRDGNEPWLPHTLRSVAALNVPGGAAMLQRIVAERRWFVWPAWPRACRQAALETLAGWRQRGASKATADPSSKSEEPS
jgi:hypothetical protein